MPAFRSATSRAPKASEVDLLTSRFHKLQAHYTKNIDEAELLSNVGEMNVTTSVSKDELAAYTTVCLMILNLDEALNK